MTTARTELDDTKSADEAHTIDFSIHHEVPEQLGLIGLGLTDKELEEQVIPYIKAHPEIELVQLSDNKLTDKSARALAELNLKYLILEKNEITFIGAMLIAKNRSLITVNLNDNEIGDAGLKAFKNNTTVLNLHVSGNKITNEGVKEISENQTLESLSLEDNQIFDEGVMYLPKMAKLKRVSLAGTEITNAGFLFIHSNKSAFEILTLNDWVAIPPVNTLPELLAGLKVYNMENTGIILQGLSLEKLRQILQAGSHFQAAVTNKTSYVGDEYNAKRLLMGFTQLYIKTLEERVATGGWFSQPKKEKSPAAEFLFQLLASTLTLEEIDTEIDKHPEFDAAFKDKSRISWSVGDLTALRDQLKLVKDPEYRKAPEAPAPKKGWW